MGAGREGSSRAAPQQTQQSNSLAGRHAASAADLCRPAGRPAAPSPSPQQKRHCGHAHPHPPIHPCPTCPAASLRTPPLQRLEIAGMLINAFRAVIATTPEDLLPMVRACAAGCLKARVCGACIGGLGWRGFCGRRSAHLGLRHGSGALASRLLCCAERACAAPLLRRCTCAPTVWRRRTRGWSWASAMPRSSRCRALHAAAHAVHGAQPVGGTAAAERGRELQQHRQRELLAAPSASAAGTPGPLPAHTTRPSPAASPVPCSAGAGGGHRQERCGDQESL